MHAVWNIEPRWRVPAVPSWCNSTSFKPEKSVSLPSAQAKLAASTVINCSRCRFPGGASI